MSAVDPLRVGHPYREPGRPRPVPPAPRPSLIHRAAHALGWNLGYVDHFRDAAGHLFIGHVCGGCGVPNAAGAVHSVVCECWTSPNGGEPR